MSKRQSKIEFRTRAMTDGIGIDVLVETVTTEPTGESRQKGTVLFFRTDEPEDSINKAWVRKRLIAEGVQL